ncbi:MAG: galactose ABC transporter substrate-binding protein [Veillonella sp.]|uniref:galactose ABC transporter substrate-binding protein n=1 Tax=Veillonella sp. TaxID=1926307 RepID=UPI0025F7CDAB|nr:galactose ABC transporter substrate-binding protein [Veillonella sp.]MBS4913504.1 galactose ABC transporter substrate-binding protein [Veillonella sp.]
MKKSWKAALLATLAVATLALSGCGTSSSGGGDLPQMGVAIYKFDDTFMSGVRARIEADAKDKAKVDIVDSQNSQPTQNEKIDLFLNKKYKAIGVNIVDRPAAGVIIDKAKAANVPVVFLNREPLKEDMAKWDKVYYVGAKAEQSGEMQGKILADYFKAHPEAYRSKDNVLHYVLIKGEPGHQDAELRSKYVIESLKKEGIQVEELAQDTAMWDRVKGQEKMAAFLASYGDKIDAVIANNDDMALGAIEALKAAGYFKDGKYMPVVGVDATAPAVQALKDGTLLGTVLNNSKKQGDAVFNLMLVLAKGETPTKDNIGGFEIVDKQYIWVPYEIVTKDNADKILGDK